MPPFTSLRDFISAISTGNTNITRVLEELANDKELRADPAVIADIQRPNSFDPLPRWFITHCIQNRMQQKELDHIGGWPPQEKEAVRSLIASAWSDKRKIRFSWKLHDGERKHEVERDPDQTVRVVFCSPRANVRLSTKINLGEVEVDA